MEHTKEPWYFDGDGVYSSKDCEGAPIAHVMSMGYDNDFCNIDARRIVACVNACAGMPQDDLEELAKIGVMELTVYADDMRQQRDELLAALERYLNCDRTATFGGDTPANQARAVIQKVRGGE